ncbi:TIGR02466 family protein [soil metagenome]
MTVRSLFASLLYRENLDDPGFVEELEHSCHALSEDDLAGRRWSKEHGYRGYTSYASLDDLPVRDPNFGELKRRLDRHVAAFANACAFDLGGRKLKLDSLWANVLKPGGGHSGHIHPHSVVSGTMYVTVPEGAGGLRLEDPRLGLMMAAPQRDDDAPEHLRTFVTINPAPGDVLLWESWMRHEVMPHTGKGERVSVSFNYRW